MEATSKRSIELTTPVQFLPGVGPDRAERLQKLGLATARDLLFYFPRDYTHLSVCRTATEFREGEPTSFVGRVIEAGQHVTRSGTSMYGLLLQNGSTAVRAIWFNQSYMVGKYQCGQRLLVSGKPRLRGQRWEFVHPQVAIVSDDEQIRGEILPVYPLTEGIKQHKLRQIIQNVVASCAALIPESFCDDFRQRHGLLPIAESLRQIHEPASQAVLEQARYRLVYQELLVMQLGTAVRKQQLADRSQAPRIEVTPRIDKRIRDLFSFSLTSCQNAAILRICADMADSVPMNRLLQGDVGTGKTAVAAYAMLLASACGYQAALVAPTEVLARQHLDTFQSMLGGSRLRFGLLSGSLTAAQRRDLLQQLSAGDLDLVVGTQALLRDEVRFQRLGLAVIDEQHKFGVLQRKLLRQGDTDPHMLVMTATPIPRTVAMTVFGDLDVSKLRSRPPGRQPVHTYLADESQRKRWWEFFRKKLSEGQQGFVIAPWVEQVSEQHVSVEDLFEHLSNGELADYRLDILHGRLDWRQKQEVFQRFRQGKIDVLVATSVIEVGVDVPNANLMTIEHGEHFGIAQLHQLRGRIGRGDKPGYVCVFMDSDSEGSEKRLRAFADTNDGFQLAEIDFQQRGPGELFGTRQHGIPPLLVADLRRDQAILQVAREDARQLVQADPGLRHPDQDRLRRLLLRRYGKFLDLSDVG